MTPDQFERLLSAIKANTDAQLAVAEHVSGLAEEVANLAGLVVGAPERDDTDEPQYDMAGKPIRTS